jgi:hypothetical protein
MSQSYLRELVLNDLTPKEVPWQATIGAECVENDGGCVANDRGNLNSKGVVAQGQEESDAAYCHDQEDQSEEKKAFERKGRT